MEIDLRDPPGPIFKGKSINELRIPIPRSHGADFDLIWKSTCYICFAPIFQCEFNNDVDFQIRLAQYGNSSRYIFFQYKINGDRSNQHNMVISLNCLFNSNFTVMSI